MNPGPTQSLHDPSEEQWEKKLHLGCGGIYLLGYDNIDITGTLRRGTNWRHNAASIGNYYARLEGDALHLPTRRETIVDKIANITDLPYESNSVDKVVAIQVLEHLRTCDVNGALSRWWNILRPNGVLIVSVPRMDDTLELLHNADMRTFAIRHIEGALRDGYSRHRSWFNVADIEWLLAQHGFDRIQNIPNFHVYPAVVTRCRKADGYVPDRSYQMPLPNYDASCERVLDVGPGRFPLSFATRCLDITDDYRESRSVPADLGDVENIPYADASFDYVYASHVLEHTQHPVRALNELQRVGKRGYVEVPSVMLDWLMQHGKAHPRGAGEFGRWMCLQIRNGIVFVERDDSLLSGFTDEEFGKWAYRVTHYSIPLSPPEQYMRHFFWRNQRLLNVSATWNEYQPAHAIEITRDGRMSQ